MVRPLGPPTTPLARPIGRVLGAWALLALVVLVSTPVSQRGWAGVTGLAFLVEFLTEGQHPWLSRRTPTPVVEALGGGAGAEGAAPDFWHPGGRDHGPWPGLLLVHGLTPDGKRDLRLTWIAGLLAHAGFAVAVPELPALKAQQLRPSDAAVVRDTLDRLAANPAVRRGPVAVIAVSVGLGPVALTLDEPALRGRVGLVVALGGYAEARELVRYFTTGAYAFDGTTGRTAVDAALAGSFLARNLDLVPDARDRAAVDGALRGRPLGPEVGPGARAVLALLQNRDPARVDALVDALPATTRDLLEALSPARHLGRTRARLLLVHGRTDPAIPFTESLRLAAAEPDRSRLVIVDLVGHVEGQSPSWRRPGDFARLWSVYYELLAD
jgi:pimeloyl-ACP methyl ester carboxylesterase